MTYKAKKRFICTVIAAGSVLLGGCQNQPNESVIQEPPYSQNTQTSPEESASPISESKPEESMEDNNVKSNEIQIKIGANTLTAVLEDNESAGALKALLADKPLTISASNYGGFEKVCALGTSLPRNDVQTTANAGDICLYNGDRIVIFYGSNSWSYTRLGKISNADSAELKKILSGNETELTFSLD